MASSNGAARRRPRTSPRVVSGKQIVVKVEADADAFLAAVAQEEAIATEAAAIRGDATNLLPPLFNQLYPLLRRPIHHGFIVETSRGEGKPYDSRGIRSVQVQIDRMDNVLTPLWWSEQVAYHDDGKLCEVTVMVNGTDCQVRRSAWGGVNRGSTQGNLYKGSYTNAAKLAFARLGVGHEVYIGATDYDPDVNADVAEEQTKTDRSTTASQPEDTGQPIGAAKAGELVDVAWTLGLQEKLQLAASHVVGDDVGDCSNKTIATKALSGLTQVQAAKVQNWLSRKADTMAAETEGRS
jgi:hypothetical protein